MCAQLMCDLFAIGKFLVSVAALCKNVVAIVIKFSELIGSDTEIMLLNIRQNWNRWVKDAKD